MDRIIIAIELGNAAMQTQDDVAWLLRQMAARIEEMGDVEDAIGETFRDENGHTVARIFGDIRGVPAVQ